MPVATTAPRKSPQRDQTAPDDPDHLAEMVRARLVGGLDWPGMAAAFSMTEDEAHDRVKLAARLALGRRPRTVPGADRLADAA